MQKVFPLVFQDYGRALVSFTGVKKPKMGDVYLVGLSSNTASGLLFVSQYSVVRYCELLFSLTSTGPSYIVRDTLSVGTPHLNGALLARFDIGSQYS